LIFRIEKDWDAILALACTSSIGPMLRVNEVWGRGPDPGRRADKQARPAFGHQVVQRDVYGRPAGLRAGWQAGQDVFDQKGIVGREMPAR